MQLQKDAKKMVQHDFEKDNKVGDLGPLHQIPV